MVPTPTPAPPMPMHAMPAPMYFAAIGSMTRAPLGGWQNGCVVVAGMQRIVEIDAGEDGKDIGLQHCDQQLERGERDRERHGQRGAEHAENACCPQHGHESGEYF